MPIAWEAVTKIIIQYCSRICCMYSLKYSRLIKQQLGADTNVYQMYIDMRCFGKGHEEFYKQAADEGVNFIRGKIGQITTEAQTEEEKGKLTVVCEDSLLGAMIRVPVRYGCLECSDDTTGGYRGYFPCLLTRPFCRWLLPGTPSQVRSGRHDAGRYLCRRVLP